MQAFYTCFMKFCLALNNNQNESADGFAGRGESDSYNTKGVHESWQLLMF